ncbi:MAG: cache domain-containing protein, partial [Nostocaceae cyanobacterium]|nr:cache domain-containing protein [Nostocaceae cyanobacterium]
MKLRNALIVPFVVQIVGTVGLVGYLSFHNGQKAVNKVASQLRREISDRTLQYLVSYLEKPHLINQINASAIRLGELNLADTNRLAKHFQQQLQLFDSVTSVAIAAEGGEGVGAFRQSNGKFEIAIKDNSSSTVYQYVTNSQGNPIKLARKIFNYDARRLAWYRVALQEGKATWTPIVIWKIRPISISINASLPLYDENRNFQGVLTSGLSFDQINQFLQKLKISQSGKAFIIERS